VSTDPFTRAADAAGAIAASTGRDHHDVAIVLGSGLADAAPALGEPRSRIGFCELPGFPAVVAPGQRPELRSVAVGDLSALVFLGRMHLYEGRTPAEVAHPVRTALATGCSTVVITNAAGGIREGFAPGGFVLISDHLNLTGRSPLTGLSKGQGGRTPFVDLTDAWSHRLREVARKVDRSLEEGVYAQLGGPHFETPAEIRMLRTLGADLVGMSSVIELIAARHLGADVLGVSVVTNLAAGMVVEDGAVSAGSIVEVAQSQAGRLGGLIREVLQRL